MKNTDQQYNNEADVETKFIYDILLKSILGISVDRIHFHVPVKITQGRTTITKEADAVIQNENGENIIVIDSKSPTEKLENYFSQIDSYAFQLETPISILSNYYRTIVRVYLTGNKKEIVLDRDNDYLLSNNYKDLKDIVNKYLYPTTTKQINLIQNKNQSNKDIVTDYRRLFRQIHTKIRSIDKLDPSASFDEFSKILFIKIINDILIDDERLTPERIQVYGTMKQQAKYIDDWFQEKVREYYPGIFANNEKISVSPKALCLILEMLENSNFNLKDNFTDIKGRAFEEFLPSQLRGKGLGQFFTPRPIVDFMIEIADIKVSDKVLDFASGSGGFLIKAFDKKRQLIEQMPQQYFDFLEKTKDDLLEETKTQIYGIDAEPRAVRTAKMNMLLWGDGKQIQHGNGLDIKDYKGNPYFAKEYKDGDEKSGVDVILANPPFGSTEEEQTILKRYTLSAKIKKTDSNGNTYIENKKEKTEHLFIEKAYKMLKPGGKLLIVLPEGILSNDDSKVRDYILSHFIIDTIVKLPKHAFVMSGVDTINTVIIIARKNTKKRINYIIDSDKNTWINKNNTMTINFASVNQIGYEPSGKILYNGYDNSDLNTIANKLMKKDYETVLSDPIEYAELEFGDNSKSEFWKNKLHKFLRIKFDTIPSRLDPTYYFFYEESKDILESFIPLNITENNIRKIKLTEDELNEDVERIYKYISVIKTIDGSITDIEEKTIDELLSSKESFPQKIFKGDIVFNPYRINTGSIIYVDTDEENLITSPAYYVLRNLNINSKYLVQLLKTPFMKYQIQVLASGSVRDNFSKSGLYSLRIPKISEKEQTDLLEEVLHSINDIKMSEIKISNEIKKIGKILSVF